MERPCISIQDNIVDYHKEHCENTAPTGNRTQGKCLEGIYVTTTPLVLVLHLH